MANTKRVDKSLFFDDHYLGKPADEEDKIISRRIEILQSFPDFFKAETLIDVGCGNGSTICRISAGFRECLGIDIYDYSEQFKKLCDKEAAENCSFQRLNLEKEKLDRRFDRLVCFEVIEHLENENSIARFHDILTDDALLAISVPNKWWIFETHGAKLPLLPWNRIPFFSWLPTAIHQRYANARIYTEGRIIRLFEKHSFEVLHTRYITAPMDVLKDGKLKRFLTKYIFRNNTTSNPLLSTSIFLLAKRKLN